MMALFTMQPRKFECASLADPTKRDECNAYYTTALKHPSVLKKPMKINQYWNKYIRWDCALGGTDAGTCLLKDEADKLHISAVAVMSNITMRWDVSGIGARSVFDSLEKTAKAVNGKAPPGMKGFQVRPPCG